MYTIDRLNTEAGFRNFAKLPYWRHAAAAMEPLRKALGYVPRQEVVPTSPNVSVGPRATYDQRLTLPPGSFLWAISGSGNQAEGFTVQLTDFGAAGTLFAAPISIANLTGAQAPAGIVDAAGAAVSLTWPMHLLNLPRPIVEPGILNAQITNRSNTANRIQLVLWFFTPPPASDPRNEWNTALETEVAIFRRIVGGHVAAGGPAQDLASNQTINCATIGALPITNLIVPGMAGFRVAVHQLSLYNTAVQTIRLLNGADAGAIDLQGPLTDFPAQSGYGLAYQTEPHFVCDDGSPFSINLTDTSGSGGGAVTGFAKFRLLRTWAPSGTGA